MKIHTIVLTASIFLATAFLTGNDKIGFLKWYSYLFLGVSRTATQQEIEDRIKYLKSQKYIRDASFWPTVKKAYKALTDKEFDLFEIRYTYYMSFACEYEKLVNVTASRILHVDQNATKEEIDEMLQIIWCQKIVRTPAQQLMILIAYEYLTGNRSPLVRDLTKIVVEDALIDFETAMKRVESLYAVLGVDLNATQDEIKSKAQELWMQDIVRSPEALNEINEASIYLTGKNLKFKNN